MRLRQLVLACGLSSFLLSSGVSALGLGEVRVKSALNQPLQAEIQLLDTRDLSADQIIVALAAPADFERNGLERPYFYTEFQFEVQMDAPGGPKVVISSYSPVREPYLNFLVEARWSAGRLLREYTLLMDLPKFDGDRAAPTITSTPVAAPQANQAARPAPVVRQAAPAQSAPAASVQALPADQYQVRANDTLWDIAKTISRASGVSIHQVMMALYEANPEAFINGNINLLRRGQVMRVPATDTMAARPRRESVAQFAALAQTPRDTSMGAQLDGSSRRLGTQSDVAEGQGQVKLSAPARGDGVGSGADNGRGAALEGELSATLEELDKSRADNAELSSRVKELEAQVDTMEQLIAVSSEKLKTMQVAAQQVDAATDAQASAGDSQLAAAAASEAAAPATEPSAAVTPAQTSNAAVKAPVRSPSLMERASQYAPWAGVGAALLLLGGYAVYRRRQQALEDAEAERLAQEGLGQDDFSGFGAVVNDTLDPLDEAIANQGSVMERADVYIGFGQYDRAETLLREALELAPDDVELHEKLAHVQQLQEAAPASSAGLNAALVGGAAVAATAVSMDIADDLSNFDLDLPDDTTVIRHPVASEPAVAADVAPTPNELEAELDLLDFDTAFDVPEDAPASSSAFADDEFDLDLDVNDIDLASLDSEMQAFDAPVSPAPAASDIFDADLANLEAAFDPADFALDDALPAASAPAEAPLENNEILGFNEEDLANIESTFDLAEFDLDLEVPAVAESVAASSPDADTAFAEFSLEDDFLNLSTLDAEAALQALDTQVEAAGGFSAEDLALSEPQMPLTDAQMDAELDFLVSADEASTKLDLARAYIDMGDSEGARDILGEVANEGNAAQQLEAQELIKQLGA